MNRGTSKVIPNTKAWLRPLVRIVVSRLPRPASRLTGALAKEGGVPVRDIRFRPWASDSDGSFCAWHSGARARLRQVFLSGIEGLPQPLSQEFAQQWATYCGCRYGLLTAARHRRAAHRARRAAGSRRPRLRG